MGFADKVRAIHKIGPAHDQETEDDSIMDPETLASQFLQLTEPPETGTISWPRASSLQDSCMRMHVIGFNSNTTRKEWASFKTRMLFGIGNAVHEYAQNTPWLFGDRRVGWWRCGGCEQLLHFGQAPEKACSKCGAGVGAIKYYEHPLRMTDPVLVTGHIDMFLLRNGKVRVAEMKTMSGPMFENLKAPLVSHEWQVQTYMWASSVDPKMPMKIDPEVGYIFYISKGWHAKLLPIKAFAIKRSPALKSRIIEKLKQFSDHYKTYPKTCPPPDNRCVKSDWGSAFSRGCPVREECMARKD